MRRVPQRTAGRRGLGAAAALVAWALAACLAAARADDVDPLTRWIDAIAARQDPRFVGPLASPREPWHYTYVAEAMSAD